MADGQRLFDIGSINVVPNEPSTVYVAGEEILDDRARIVVRRSDDLGGRTFKALRIEHG